MLCAEPKEYKHFRPGTRPGISGTRPGGSVTGVTEKLFMCQVFMCLFRPLVVGSLLLIRKDWDVNTSEAAVRDTSSDAM